MATPPCYPQPHTLLLSNIPHGTQRDRMIASPGTQPVSPLAPALPTQTHSPAETHTHTHTNWALFYELNI